MTVVRSFVPRGRGGQAPRAATAQRSVFGELRPYVPQSAVVPWKWERDAPRILLVTSRMTGRWVIPKGMIEPSLSFVESAAKEAYEEAGVLGAADSRCLGAYRYMKRRRGVRTPCRVWVYPLRVTTVLGTWPEYRDRRRAWMSVADACERVREPDLSRILQLLDWRLRGRSEHMSSTMSLGSELERRTLASTSSSR